MNNILTQAAILIIDDFESMRTMLRDFVRSMGAARVDIAGNAREAISLLGNKTYDLVICDFNLGDGPNGQQVLEEARMHNMVGVSTIWIMVTAEMTHDMVMSTAEVKPDDYLLKPINKALLESRLSRQITRKQSLGPIEAAIKERDYHSALAHCEQQLSTKTPNPQEVLRIKSELLMKVGDYEGATFLFDTVLAVRAVPWAKTGLGRILFHTQKYASAKKIFEQVLQEHSMYMEASDWLAKTCAMLGDTVQAQQVLLEAVKTSPNSPIRQKLLGDAAYKNGDLDVALAAFEKTIRISEFSPYKNPSAYAGLAKVLADTDEHQDALRVLDRGKKMFAHNPEATIQTTSVESVVYCQMGETEKADAAITEVERLIDELSDIMSAEVSIDVAKALFKLGRKEKACTLLRDVVKNNHENAEISRCVEAAFEEEGLAEEGQALIAKSRQEVIAINNEGVMLAKNGDSQGGANLLREAAKKLPNNDTILVNLCGLLIGLMSKDGKDDQLIAEVRHLLDRVGQLNPANKKYHAYTQVLSRVKLSSKPKPDQDFRFT